MRIAVPICGSNSVAVFDFADRLFVADIADNRISETREVLFKQNIPSIKAGKLRELRIDTLICGAVSNALAVMVWHSGINVVPGIRGEAEKVVEAYINGNLNSVQFCLPGWGYGGRYGWWNEGRRRVRRGKGRRLGKRFR